jgi:hypothetical protein
MPILWRRKVDQLAPGHGEEVAALEQDLAGGGLDQPREAADQGRLAGAREPHDDEDLARADLEVGGGHRRHEARLPDGFGRGVGMAARNRPASGP